MLRDTRIIHQPRLKIFETRGSQIKSWVECIHVPEASRVRMSKAKWVYISAG